MRQRRSIGVIVFTFVALVLVTSGSSGVEAQQRSAERPNQISTVMVIINSRIPHFGYHVTGTIMATLSGDAEVASAEWTFRGMVDGQRAIANGSGTVAYDGAENSLSLRVTEIDTWRIPGMARPILPKAITVATMGRSSYTRVSVADTIFSNVPMRVLPRLDNPFGGRNVFVVSLIGTGSADYQSLPGAR